MKLFKDDRGFGLVEGLLLVIALTLIFGVGYFVYSQNKSEESSQQSTETSQASQEPAAKPKIEYFKFKELGVKIPLSEGLDGLDYQVENGYMYLMTDAINTAKSKCDPYNTLSDTSSKSFASLSRQTGIYPASPGIDDGDLLKQFDGFYITAGYPNGYGCADGAPGSATNDYSDKVANAQKALQQAFKNAQVIQ